MVECKSCILQANVSKEYFTTQVRRCRASTTEGFGEEKALVHTFTIILFDHLHVWIFWEAVLTHRREVRSLPARAVEILLNLGRHVGPTKGE